LATSSGGPVTRRLRIPNPSVISQFIIFCLAAYYSIIGFNNKHTFLEPVDSDAAVKFILILFFLNGLWFYFAGWFVEQVDTNLSARPRWVRVLEWLIRVGNQVWMLLMPVAIRWSPDLFGLYLCVLYASFIAWDLLMVRRREPYAFFGIFDGLGLLLSLIFWGIVYFLVHPGAPPLSWIATGGVGVVYALLAIVGIVTGIYMLFRPAPVHSSSSSAMAASEVRVDNPAPRSPAPDRPHS
jgi:hypothetical protein